MHNWMHVIIAINFNAGFQVVYIADIFKVRTKASALTVCLNMS